jgi:hypothetical protein
METSIISHLRIGIRTKRIIPIRPHRGETLRLSGLVQAPSGAI